METKNKLRVLNGGVETNGVSGSIRLMERTVGILFAEAAKSNPEDMSQLTMLGTHLNLVLARLRILELVMELRK